MLSEKTDTTHPPPYPFFFGNMYNNKKTQKVKKKKIQKKIRVGAWPTHPLPSFLGFWLFLTSQNPWLSIYHKLFCDFQWLLIWSETCLILYIYGSSSTRVKRTAILVQWLKLPASKVGDRGCEPRSGIKVSEKQNVSSLFLPSWLVKIQHFGEPPRAREVAR